MDNLNYAVIGNCKTAALISVKGSIDWLCIPDFNSPSVFAKLLDDEIGGSFDIVTDESYEITQQYVKNTNIVSTVFRSGDNSFEVLDFIPRFKNTDNTYHIPSEIVRYIRFISGTPVFTVRFNPRLDYAKQPTKIVDEGEYIKSFTTKGDYDSIYLYSDLNFEDIIEQRQIQLKEDAFLMLSYDEKILNQTLERQYFKLQKTEVYWLDWTYNLTSYAMYNEEIKRSALVLKLLSYQKTGAFLAAVTTSLPESLGEERNWDYRFCWIRDASMAIHIMSKLGHLNTVKRFMKFIIDIIPDKDEKIQIMYGINREKQLQEEELDHLKGYKNSAPVRIGNAAYLQKQNDIYGVLVDVIYQQFIRFKITLETSEALWTIVRGIVRIVENNWHKPDKGIWEIRTEEKHFTFSKVLCWVAINRAIKIAKVIHKKKYLNDWQKLADTIKDNILENAWNEERQAFTQSYGSSYMDAANLLMASYGFIDAKDKRYIETVKQTEKELCYNGLLYRYKNEDDFGLPTSSFTICTFWFINALNSIGERDKAKKMFDQLLKYSNHVGLFSEDLDFKTKELLGNFPQAYSHLALIETAINLSEGELTEKEEILGSILH
ncbi:glycoside hydrolase family 15 protein [Draconibacterium halophilum]|uniref:Glycoside hydrolase family 15 protein n=1 Tax=Draconibacterium halophilum TaxID=2706887 RepID=A0A6C0REZ6_9BACT|nr:glycoside hydrolase family 15 protein [Draconibacterium halophilum]QIA08970.1 glycoside hydrolase family 15 protein [Draconibacterium halophilum]